MSNISTLDIIKDSTLSYAQNMEDIILAGFFDPSQEGFYVDVGANDPDCDSVTRIFYERGWSGINIEPIPSHYRQLCRRRQRDINLNIGISQKEQSLRLREYEGTGLSTFSKTMQEQHQQSPTVFTENYKDYTVKTKALAQVFKEQKVREISFMKVDVEGFEYDVLSSNDWEKYRPLVLCIEANHVDKDWRPLLQKCDYLQVFQDGLNEYYVDLHAKNKIQEFSYVSAVLDRKPIVDYLTLDRINQWVDGLNERIGEYENEITTLNYRINEYEKRLQTLWNKYHQVASLKKHLITSTKSALRKIDQKIIRLLSGSSKYRPAIVEHESTTKEEVLLKSKESDQETFRRFIAARKVTIPLRFYAKFRSYAFRVIKKLRTYLR